MPSSISPHCRAASVSVMVTSPPYNLGVRYRWFDDGQPREEYLRWTSEWIERAAASLSPDGSLFLNVGSKPTDPWTALDVAQQARQHLHLQNIIHWVKSIAIDRDLAGAGAGLERDLAVGHYKPINSPRFLNDCHEFVFHFTPTAPRPLDRRAIGVPYQDRSNVGRWSAAAGGRAAAATPGSFHTRRSRAAIASGRTRRPSRRGCPSSACGCTASIGSRWSSIRSSAWAVRRSRRPASGRAFVGVEIDEEYLGEAIERTRAVLR